MKIKETIIVEGRDDETAVLAAVDANIICTHGFGIRPETLAVIKKAYESTGIIIFTDPDHAGETIRDRLTKLYPDAKQAFLTQVQALKDGDIGIENARPDDILKALENAHAAENSEADRFDISDLDALGLCGGEGSSRMRSAVGGRLGIGSGNTKAFLKKLNYMNISREELFQVCKEYQDDL